MCTESLSLIYVKISVPGSILAFIDRSFSNFAYKFILRRSGLGMKMGKFCQISTSIRVMALGYVKNLFPGSILTIY